MDSLGPLLYRFYFTSQWYTPWMLGMSAVAALMAFAKNRNPVIWFGFAYFLTPLAAILFLFVAPPKDRGLSSGPSAPFLVALLLIVGGGVTWAAMNKYPGMWRSMSGLKNGTPFEPQIITIKRPVTVRTAERDVPLSAGTRVWAGAKRNGYYLVKIGASEAFLPADAAGF